MRDDKQGNEAWIGDAVLALFAREWILKDPSITPKERAVAFKNMTSNQFLSSVGKPTAMEARIGHIYEAQGLQAAFDHIEATFVPIFKKQQAKARRPGSYRG
jgi:dsRNA-specific ribonuclease